MLIVIYAECHIFIVMLIVIMLNVVPTSVVYEYRDLYYAEFYNADCHLC